MALVYEQTQQYGAAMTAVAPGKSYLAVATEDRIDTYSMMGKAIDSYNVPRLKYMAFTPDADAKLIVVTTSNLLLVLSIGSDGKFDSAPISIYTLQLAADAANNLCGVVLSEDGVLMAVGCGNFVRVYKTRSSKSPLLTQAIDLERDVRSFGFTPDAMGLYIESGDVVTFFEIDN